MHMFLLALDVVAGNTFLLQFCEAVEELVRSRTIRLFRNKPRTVVVNQERVDFARELAGELLACLILIEEAVDFIPGPVQRLVCLVHEFHPVSVLCQLEREHEGLAVPRHASTGESGQGQVEIPASCDVGDMMCIQLGLDTLLQQRKRGDVIIAGAQVVADDRENLVDDLVRVTNVQEVELHPGERPGTYEQGEQNERCPVLVVGAVVRLQRKDPRVAVGRQLPCKR